MKITQTQLEQVNDRMQALIRSNSFYGKKPKALVRSCKKTHLSLQKPKRS